MPLCRRHYAAIAFSRYDTLHAVTLPLTSLRLLRHTALLLIVARMLMMPLR